MNTKRLPLILLRAAGAIQLVLGIAIWMGYLSQYVGLHMGIGIVFVLLLWTIAGAALRSGGAAGLASFAIVWGLVIAGFGMAQRSMLPGDLHWIVRVAHLVISMAAFPIAERLSISGSPVRQ